MIARNFQVTANTATINTRSIAIPAIKLWGWTFAISNDNSAAQLQSLALSRSDIQIQIGGISTSGEYPAIIDQIQMNAIAAGTSIATAHRVVILPKPLAIPRGFLWMHCYQGNTNISTYAMTLFYE